MSQVKGDFFGEAIGAFLEAQSFFQKELAIREAIGDKRGVAIYLSFLADTAQAQGEYEGAQQLYQSSTAFRKSTI